MIYMYCTRLTVSQSNELLYVCWTHTEGRTVMCHSKDTSGRLGSFPTLHKSVFSSNRNTSLLSYMRHTASSCSCLSMTLALATLETAYANALGSKSLVEEKAISVNQLFEMNIPSMIFIILRISQKSGVLSACTDSELVPGHRGGVAWGRGVEVYCCNLHMDS